jgi:hypothetical protein
MKKIPVGRTIADSYNFTFGHIGAVIGLIWLPLVIYTVGQFFIGNYTTGLVNSNDPTAVGRAVLLSFSFALVSLFFTAIIGVSLTRQAMTPRSGSIIAHFALGPTEVSYFVSLLAIFLVMLTLYIALVFADVMVESVGVAVLQASGQGATTAGKLVAAIILLLLFTFDLGALVYIGVRLAALVAPVTVAEGKMDIIRAWQMTKGNFWRLLLVLVVTVGPIFIVTELATAAIVGPAYVVKFGAAMMQLFEAAANNGQVPTQAMAQVPDISGKAPLLLGLGFFLAPFTYGLLFAAPAYAYLTLAGGRPIIPSDADAGPFRPA